MTKEEFKKTKNEYLLNQLSLLGNLQNLLDQIEFEFDEDSSSNVYHKMLLVQAERQYRIDFLNTRGCKMSVEEEKLWDIISSKIANNTTSLMAETDILRKGEMQNDERENFN